MAKKGKPFLTAVDLLCNELEKYPLEEEVKSVHKLDSTRLLVASTLVRNHHSKAVLHASAEREFVCQEKTIVCMFLSCVPSCSQVLNTDQLMHLSLKRESDEQISEGKVRR